MLSHTVIMGRLVHSPEIRHTQSGTPVASFTLAVNRDFVQEGGPTADFFDIVVWGKRSEFVEKYFSKGQQVCVAGRMQQRHWEDKNGNKRTSWDLVAEQLHFADSKKEGQGASSNSPSKSKPAQSNKADVYEFDDDDYTDISENEGDLPF